MLRISGQDLLDENPSFGRTSLAKTKIRQASLEREIFRIGPQRQPDLFLRLSIFPACFQRPDVIDLLGERLLPFRFQRLLERLNKEFLMKLALLCK